MNSNRRMVYAKVWGSEQFGQLSQIARLLYIGLITIADDDGRVVGNSKFLLSTIFPYDDDVHQSNIDDAILELHRSNIIDVYEVEKKRYIQHPNWENYQKIRADMYKPSTLPDRNGNVTPPLQVRNLSKDKLSKDNIRQGKGYSDEFERFWYVYPRKAGKGAAFKSWQQLSPPPSLQREIIKSVQLHAESRQWKRDGGQYIPHPSTFLNQRRWEDEVEENQSKSISL